MEVGPIMPLQSFPEGIVIPVSIPYVVGIETGRSSFLDPGKEVLIPGLQLRLAAYQAEAKGS